MADATFEEFFSSGGGGGVDIGDVTLQAATGTSYEKGAQFYLRTGFFVDKAPFPAAAANERCKVTGLSVTLPLAVQVYESAHDGAGTIIVAYGDTNVLRSTDWGATWATVATGMSASAVSVVRAGTRFIVAGNTSTTIETRRSNDGSAWSSGGTVTSSSMEANSVTGAWNGTIAMFVARNNATAALTTPDGAALTQRTLPSALQTSFIAAKGTTFILGAASGGNSYLTDTGAPGSFATVTFTSTTLPGQPVDCVVVGGVAILAGQSADQGYATSTDLTNWTRRRLPASFGARGVGLRPLTADGSRAYWGGANTAAWTADGLSWTVRPLTATANTWHVIAGRAVVPTGNQSPLALKTADWAVADFVGSTASSEVNGNLVGFKRIR
jgi:hypothetical protein